MNLGLIVGCLLGAALCFAVGLGGHMEYPSTLTFNPLGILFGIVFLLTGIWEVRPYD